MGPWGQERRLETLGAMAPGAMGPWRHGSMGAMGVEGHGGRVERGKGGASGAGGAGGHALGPFELFGLGLEA